MDSSTHLTPPEPVPRLRSLLEPVDRDADAAERIGRTIGRLIFGFWILGSVTTLWLLHYVSSEGRWSGIALWPFVFVATTAVMAGPCLFFIRRIESNAKLLAGSSAAAARERLITQFLESIPNGVAVVDRTGQMVFTNRAAKHLMGRPIPSKTDPDALPSHFNIYQRGTDEPYPMDRYPTRRALAGESAFVEDMELRRPDRTLLLSHRGTPIHDADGKVAYAVVVIQDITERKRAEESLANEREQLAVTLRSIADGVVTTDGEGAIVTMNRAAEHLTGWSRGEAVGRPLRDVFVVEPDEDGRAESLSARFLASDPYSQENKGEASMRMRSGAVREIAYSLAAIRDPSSEVRGHALCFRDVTEARALEEQRLRASKLDSVGLLAGGIAHDFNNILTALLASASLAREDTEDADMLEYLDEIETATLRARDLTQQLLTFSAGGSPILATSSLDELLRESVRFALRGSNVGCTFSIAEDLRPVDIDRGQINQVINNLVINAAQSMPEGGEIRIEASNEPCEDCAMPCHRGVRIDIHDTGAGIPTNHLDKIFDPYFTTKEAGTGLGLATSYSIIKRHGGALSVASTLGVGTSFSIRLPASENTVGASATDDTPVRGVGRVLVMDDEEPIRRVAARLFSRLGFEVETTCCGEETLEAVEAAQRDERAFDCIVMDLTIPGGKGGLETVAGLREAGCTVPIVASSGYSTDPIMARYQTYGFDAVLTKPYTLRDVSEVMRELTCPAVDEDQRGPHSDRRRTARTGEASPPTMGKGNAINS